MAAPFPETPFGAEEFNQFSDPDLTGRTFLATLIANWLDYPQLIAISPQLYADEAPEENLPSYVVLSLVASNDRGRNTGRGYWKEAFYQFAVYANTKVLANTLGIEMCLYLDRLQDVKPVLSEGYLMSWFHAGERSLKVPGRGKAGKFVWQEAHTYKAEIGKYREAP
jgi:hypothetical protein